MKTKLFVGMQLDGRPLSRKHPTWASYLESIEHLLDGLDAVCIRAPFGIRDGFELDGTPRKLFFDASPRMITFSEKGSIPYMPTKLKRWLSSRNIKLEIYIGSPSYFCRSRLWESMQTYALSYFAMQPDFIWLDATSYFREDDLLFCEMAASRGIEVGFEGIPRSPVETRLPARSLILTGQRMLRWQIRKDNDELPFILCDLYSKSAILRSIDSPRWDQIRKITGEHIKTIKDGIRIFERAGMESVYLQPGALIDLKEGNR